MLLVKYILPSVRNFSFLLISLFCIDDVNADSDNKHFAVVNMQKISESCAVFQDIRNQMNDQLKVLSTQFDKRGQEIKISEKKIEDKKSIVTPAAYSNEVAKLNEAKRITQEELENKRKDLQNIYFNVLQDLNTKLLAVVEEQEKKNDYYAVFEASTLVHSKLDNITDKVIEEVNKAVPSYKIKFDGVDTKPETKK